MSINTAEAVRHFYALYARENCIGFMIIFGKTRAKFETERNYYSKQVQKIYDESKTYRDGKWVMFGAERYIHVS